MITFLVTYLVLGFLVSEMANIGHKRKFDKPLPRFIYAAGIALWPFMMIIGGRK